MNRAVWRTIYQETQVSGYSNWAGKVGEIATKVFHGDLGEVGWEERKGIDLKRRLHLQGRLPLL